jgi:DNA-binding NarL/FixJ family response regulator
MRALYPSLFLSRDGGLIRHWTQAVGSGVVVPKDAADPLIYVREGVGTVWVDLSLSDLPPWSHPQWSRILRQLQLRVIAASSSPSDDEGMAALDAGCAAYCHAFSDTLTLKRIQEVVEAGNVWIGRNLMNRLLKSTARVGQGLSKKSEDWSEGLTARELEVAQLAANGASNQAIAANCKITERTVKAHLSAVFEKLNVTDRLQLALRVHGIQ